MPDLKFAVVFSAIDHLSGTLGSIGERMLNLGHSAQRTAENVGNLGERLTGLGEKLTRVGTGAAIISAAVNEGTDRLREWSDAIHEPAEAMQKNMATLAAMTGLAGDALAKVKEHAVEFSSTQPGATAEQWTAGFTRMRDIFHDTALAEQAEDSAVMLGRLAVSSNAATRLMQVGWSNLGISATAVGDQFTRAAKTFGLNPAETNSFAQAVRWLGADTAAVHAPFSEVLALASEASQLMGGGRGSTMFASMIHKLEEAAATGKATIDFSHGLTAALQQLKSQLSGTSTEKLVQLADMGLGAQGPQLLKLLDNLDQVAAKQKQIGAGGLTLAQTYATATDNLSDATQRLHQNYSNLADALGSPALKGEPFWTNHLADAVGTLAQRLESHKAIAGAATIAVTGIGEGVDHAVKAMSTLGTVSVFAGQGFKAMQYAMKALDFEGWALRGMYMIDAIKSIARATDLWTIAQGALDIVLGPIGIAAGAIRAVGLGAYEDYKHWDDIKKVFTDAEDWLKVAGLNMMKNLGEGILEGAEYPFKAAWGLAEKVGGLFHFHSPPEYGPLRAAVLNFRLGEALAERFQPTPSVAVVSQMAARMAAPIRVLAAAPAQVVAVHTLPQQAPRPGTTINIHYSPKITVAGGDAAPDRWIKAAREHADELVRIVESKLARAARLSYE